jgi:hypothetical protein
MSPERMRPEDLVPYIVVVAALVLLVVYLRARELFCVSVRGGRTLLVRGRIPAGLLSSIGEVVRRDGVKRGTVKALRGEHSARLVTSGMSEATEQRLRNVFGRHVCFPPRCIAPWAFVTTSSSWSSAPPLM